MNKITKKTSGKFITFEGIDGAGKSSHITWFSGQLASRGIPVVLSREPGGTPLGEKLRDIVLNDNMEPATEALLVFACRQEHILQVIAPALKQGNWVLSDRFSDSTFAYQGYGRGFPLNKLEALETWVHADLQPDLTVFFDCSPAIAAARLAADRLADKFERESLDFFTRVREGYLARSAQWPRRFAIINSDRSMDEVRGQLAPLIEQLTAE